MGDRSREKKDGWTITQPDWGIKTNSKVVFGRKWWQFWKRKGVWVETEPGSNKFKKWEAPKPSQEKGKE